VTSRALRHRRRAVRRRRLVVGLAVVVAAAAGGTGVLLTRKAGSSHRAATRSVRAPVAPPTTTTVAPTTTTTVDPGTLPQTMDRPTTADAGFQAGLAGFWQAVVTDDPTPAMPFFFPLAAYQQVKAISNPASDGQQRLVGAYQRDIHSLHASLGTAAASAQFTGIDVPASAQWVLPGGEYNKLPYWRVYGAQVRYSVAGRAGSFTIASMISWRGRWYIVHLARIA
jgi:hypothetical protein